MRGEASKTRIDAWDLRSSHSNVPRNQVQLNLARDSSNLIVQIIGLDQIQIGPYRAQTPRPTITGTSRALAEIGVAKRCNRLMFGAECPGILNTAARFRHTLTRPIT